MKFSAGPFSISSFKDVVLLKIPCYFLLVIFSTSPLAFVNIFVFSDFPIKISVITPQFIEFKIKLEIICFEVIQIHFSEHNSFICIATTFFLMFIAFSFHAQA
jgi:hypothetical protein